MGVDGEFLRSMWRLQGAASVHWSKRYEPAQTVRFEPYCVCEIRELSMGHYRLWRCVQFLTIFLCPKRPQAADQALLAKLKEAGISCREWCGAPFGEICDGFLPLFAPAQGAQ